MTAIVRGWIAGVVALSLLGTASASAQDAKSVALAKQLAAALSAAKLDSIAAKDPSAPDAFIGALFFPGQFLVISAKYAVPALLDTRLFRKEYRDVYLDLNGAAVANTKTFIEDGGADGLRAERNGDLPFDTYETGGVRMLFDGDWKKQKLSKEDYQKAFAAADERYSQMLQALLAELKKPT
jgi:hypothetical protein